MKSPIKKGCTKKKKKRENFPNNGQISKKIYDHNNSVSFQLRPNLNLTKVSPSVTNSLNLLHSIFL